jgi:hypothetical protein
VKIFKHNILFQYRQGQWHLATILDFDTAWAGLGWRAIDAAGLLLFGRAPQQFIPQSMVRLVRFQGTSPRNFIAKALALHIDTRSQSWYNAYRTNALPTLRNKVRGKRPRGRVLL